MPLTSIDWFLCGAVTYLNILIAFNIHYKRRRSLNVDAVTQSGLVTMVTLLAGCVTILRQPHLPSIPDWPFFGFATGPYTQLCIMLGVMAGGCVVEMTLDAMISGVVTRSRCPQCGCPHTKDNTLGHGTAISTHCILLAQLNGLAFLATVLLAASYSGRWVPQIASASTAGPAFLWMILASKNSDFTVRFTPVPTLDVEIGNVRENGAETYAEKVAAFPDRDY